METYNTWRTTVGNNTACGYQAWKEGYGQKVISFSVFGDSQQYLIGLDDILRSTKILYPGWYVRFYTKPNDFKEILVGLLAKYDHLHICDVTSLPLPFEDVSLVHGRLWRFLPLADPLVDVMLSRDTDSKILPREADAVAQWLVGNTTLHVMRDHPEHATEILAGMWGAQIFNRREFFLNAITTILHDAEDLQRRSLDQILLTFHIYRNIDKDFVAHDSYSCATFPKSHPFPTRRQGLSFIGSPNNFFEDMQVTEKCPSECRPPNHADWEYC